MKKTLAVVLIALSSQAFADRPFACNEQANANSAVACNPGQLSQQEFATVPSPGTLALMALGLTGMMISWRKSK